MKGISYPLFGATIRAMLRRWVSLLILLVVLAGCLASIVLSGMIHRQQVAVNEVISNSIIRCVITDPQGLRQPKRFTPEMINTLLEDPAYGEYITDLDVLQGLYFEVPGVDACGILSLSSDPSLVQSGATVSFIDGYTEEVFRTSQRVCLIPATHKDWYPDGVVHAELAEGITAELTIIGTVEGGAGETYYIPYPMSWDIESNYTVRFFLTRCVFNIKDNTKLDEAKAFLWNSDLFQEAKRTNRLGGKQGLVIQDEVYQQTLRELQANLRLLMVLRPVILILVGCVGFFTGNLATTSRIKEFAVMRCLGMKKGKIFRLAILEQFMLSLLGLALGLVLGVVVSGREALMVQAVLNAVAVALIFLVGTGLAATRIAGINVMKLMKVED